MGNASDQSEGSADLLAAPANLPVGKRMGGPQAMGSLPPAIGRHTDAPYTGVRPASVTPMVVARIGEGNEGYTVRILGDAAPPSFGDVSGLVVTCGCRAENLAVRLRDMKALICPWCGTIIARVDTVIIAARWGVDNQHGS